MLSSNSVGIDHIAEKPFHIFKRALHNDCLEAVTFGFASGQEVEAGAALA